MTYTTVPNTNGRRNILDDLTGQRFGRWIVLERAQTRKGRTYWKCGCECGNEADVLRKQLVNGRSNSCGCLRLDNIRLNSGKAAFNDIYSMYRSNARIRNLSFYLTQEEAFHLFTADCVYCGAPPSNVKRGKYFGEAIYNGIDRVDNTRGYESDNCVPCCKRCNRAKDVMTVTEFREWVESVYSHITALK